MTDKVDPVAKAIAPEIAVEPTTNSFQPPQVEPVELPAQRLEQPTNEELFQAEKDADQRASDASFYGLLGTGFRTENSIGIFGEQLDDSDFYLDTDFDLSEQMKTSRDRINALGLEADQDEIASILGQSVNADHFEQKMQLLEKKQADEITLAEAGMKGLAARVIPSLLDPVDIAVGIVAAPLGAGKKLTKFGAFAKGAMAAGTSSALIEAYAAANNPYRDGKDVLFAGAAGITLGGPLGMLSTIGNRRLRDLADEMANDNMDHTMVELMERFNDGDKYFSPAEWKLIKDQVDEVDTAGAARRIDESLDPDSGDFDLAPNAREATEDAGADFDTPEFRYGALQKAQFNFISKLFHDSTDTTRRFASRIIEGGILVDKKATRAFTAEGRANNIAQTYGTRMFTETKSDFDAWSKGKGYSKTRQTLGIEANEEFFTEVGNALRGITKDVSPEAASAATKIRPMLNEMHKMAKDMGIPGFEDADALENFFPRQWSRQKMDKIRADVDDEDLAEWFKGAILNKFDDIDDAVEETALRIANGFVKGLRRQHQGMDQMLQHGIPIGDVDRLKEMFEGIDDSIADEIIERFQKSADASNRDAGKVKHGRQRLRFDETYDNPVRTKDGGSMNMSVDLMTNSDAGKVIPRYFQVMGGTIGLAKEANLKSQADIDNLIKTVQNEGASDEEVKALKDVIQLVQGQSIETNPYSTASGVSRLSMGWNYARVGGSFGVAQIPEMGNIIGEVGVRNFIRFMPEYASLLRRMEDGTIDNELMAELEQLVAAGTDWANGGARSAFDEHGIGFNSETLSKADGVLKRAGRLTSLMSGMAPINAFLERVATFDIAQDWAQFATKSKKLTTAKKARLRAAGLSDEAQENIFENIRKHATIEDGKLKNLNSDNWDDAALDDYRMALDRQRRFVIQRNDIGNTGAWKENPLGRIGTQFMTFMLNSVNKQLIRQLHHNDIQTWVSFNTAMFFGGLAYMAQTSIDFANDKEKRKERLTPERIAAAAYQRAGFSAVTIPLIDSMLYLAGQDQLFKYGRTSGLGTDFITGNPTLQLANDVAQTVTLPARLLDGDYRYSQEDARRWQRLVPLYRTLGIKNGFHAINDDLPKRSKSP